MADLYQQDEATYDAYDYEEDLGVVIGHIGGMFVVSDEQDNQELKNKNKKKKKPLRIQISAETLPRNKETASVHIWWTCKAKSIMFFEVVCETAVEKGEQVFEERMSTMVGEKSNVEVSGLRYNQEYTIKVSGLEERGWEERGELVFKTQPRIFCPPITLSVTHSHPDISLMGNCNYVAHNYHNSNQSEDHVISGEQNWQRTRGIRSYYVYEKGNLYWEVDLVFDVLCQFYEEDLLATIGICRPGKSDVFSPLESNIHALTVSISRSGSNSISYSISDGRQFLSRSKMFNMRRGIMEVRLAFFLDMDNKLFKIFWRKNVQDEHLFTFSNLAHFQAELVCELFDPQVTNMSLKFRSGQSITDMPALLYP